MGSPWKIDTGNVYFAPGTLKEIKKRFDTIGFGCLSSPDHNIYFAKLSDGTEINFRKQVETNQSKIEKKNGKWEISGIQDMYLTSNQPAAYSLFGCKGFVNVGTNNQPGDLVFTADRKFDNGLKQESQLSIYANINDVLQLSKGDDLYNGN